MFEPSELMQRADDAWNTHNWAAFDSLHDPDCVVCRPGMENAPTRGSRDHPVEAVAFCDAVPDNMVQNQAVPLPLRRR